MPAATGSKTLWMHAASCACMQQQDWSRAAKEEGQGHVGAMPLANRVAEGRCAKRQGLMVPAVNMMMAAPPAAAAKGCTHCVTRRAEGASRLRGGRGQSCQARSNLRQRGLGARLWAHVYRPRGGGRLRREPSAWAGVGGSMRWRKKEKKACRLLARSWTSTSEELLQALI